MRIVFTEDELQSILDELGNLPIKYLQIVQKIQSLLQKKYQEAVESEDDSQVE